jgi:peptidoglycan/LPS O-acetylase OafA/YrhL
MLDIDLKSIPFEKNNFKAFVENIFLVNAVLPGRAHTYNYPAWSISTEFYTYFLFALITLVSTKRHLFFAVFALTSLILLYTGNTFGFEQVIRCFAGFFVGCLVADFTKSKGKGLDNIIPIGFMVGITLFLCLKTSKSFDILMFPLAAGLIMSLCLSRGGILSTLLKLSPLIWLGTISYSVYMAHASVEFIIHKVIIYVLGAPLLPHTSGALVPALTSSETVLVCLVYLICTIVVSVLVFRYVESPAREGSRRLIALR